MVRVVLLLAIVGVLLLFLLQNSSVVLPLTILGIKTVALPVAVWVLGAIAAGSVTALLTGALVRLGGGRRVSSRRRAASSRSRSGASGTPWTPPPWTGRGAEPQDAPRNGGRGRSQDDDWGTSSSGDDWDEWARGAEAPRTTVRPPVTPPIRDAEFRPLDVETVYPEPDYEPTYSNSYDNSYSPYSEYGASTPDYTPGFYEEPEEKEVWDDWEDEAARPAPPPPPPPPEEVPPARDIVEIRRDPQSTQRTGTIYSFSYRTDEEVEEAPPEPPSTGATVIQEPVTDAPVEEAPVSAPEEEPRIRVIIPPYRSTPEPPSAPEPPETDDWDDHEDDANDRYDEGADDADVTGNREVWDDWDEEPDEPDSPGGGSPPRSPNGNPPLKF